MEETLTRLATIGPFYLLAGLVIISASLVVSFRNVFHSALALVTALGGVAGIFLYLDAEFLAIVQVLIYVGAIVTLIIFAIMLTARISDGAIRQTNEQRGIAALISGSVAILLIAVFSQTSWHPVRHGPPIDLHGLGRALLNEYALPFEVISVALLVAMIGAIVIARREEP